MSKRRRRKAASGAVATPKRRPSKKRPPAHKRPRKPKAAARRAATNTERGRAAKLRAKLAKQGHLSRDEGRRLDAYENARESFAKRRKAERDARERGAEIARDLARWIGAGVSKTRRDKYYPGAVEAELTRARDVPGFERDPEQWEKAGDIGRSIKSLGGKRRATVAVQLDSGRWLTVVPATDDIDDLYDAFQDNAADVIGDSDSEDAQVIAISVYVR